ncbi:MAG: hypothetical protein Q7S44_03665 [bacterium]|nr:hypothetical protein [bacterium]
MSFLDDLTSKLPFGNKVEDTEYFFALNIGPSEVTALVWGIYGDKLDILGQTTSAYEGTDELIEKAHQVLDRALGALEIEPQKILFGVPDSWSLDDNLKEPYLKLLRRMLKEFSLGALAFVTTTNALAFFLQKQEGVPPTAILLGVGDFVEATLSRGGKVIESRTAKRGEHLFEDIEKLLGQFTEVEVLPSKILVYPTKTGEDLGKLKDEMMTYPWMSHLSFLHFPKVETLEANIAMEAVVAAGAIEINPQVDLKSSFAQPLTSMEPSRGLGVKRLAGTEGARGFVKGDIKDQHQEPELNLEEGLEEDPLMGSDPEENFEETAISEDELLSSTSGTRSLARQKMEEENFKKIKKLLHLAIFKNLHLGGLGGKLMLLPGLIILLAAAYFFLVKASVIIYVDPRVLEQDMQVVADPNATTVDEDKKVIPASTVDTSVSGSDKGPATGQKQIGDPAKGKVVVYNLTNNPVNLSQGTTLTSSSLKFTLDSSVQIASQSSSIGADFVQVTTPGKSSSVGVTASAIGPEGNLPGGTDLSVANYSKSQVVARVEEAFSGGTSKNVAVVTSDDQKKLQAKVVDQLRQQAVTDLQGKLGADKKIISEALAVVDGKYTFSKQVNDQASEFSLSARVHFKGTAYSDADLKAIISKLVNTNTPEGYQLDSSGMETQADVAKVEKDGRLVFGAKFKAKLLPKFNEGELKKKMRGESVIQVAEQLKGLDSVLGSEIKLVPNLPAPLARLPFLEKNIEITITPK